MFELHAFLMIESISMEAVFRDDIISFANSAAAVVELITTPDFEANLDLCLQPFGVESSSNFETVTPVASSLSAFLSVSQSQQAKNMSWVLSFGELPTDWS